MIHSRTALADRKHVTALKGDDRSLKAEIYAPDNWYLTVLHLAWGGDFTFLSSTFESISSARQNYFNHVTDWLIDRILQGLEPPKTAHKSITTDLVS